MRNWFKNNKQIIRFVLFAFLIWQFLLIVFVGFGEKFIPIHHANFVYSEKGTIVMNPSIFWSRANFDGIHYLDIARKGYGIYQQAFFPFYPGLIKFLTPYFFGRALMSGLIISWLAFFGALLILYKLVRIDFNQKIAKRTLLSLLLFPTAFFFSAVYTEALFLFLVLSSFYFARKGNWWLSGFFGIFASATRLVGIFLLLAILWEWWEQNKFKFKISNLKFWMTILPLFLIPLGLLFYMRYLALHYNDPLMFAHVQSAFGAGRETDKIIPLYQVFWRYFKMVMTTTSDPIYFSIWMEFLTTVIFIVLLVFAYLRKIRFSYLVFAVLSFVFPTISGTFLSMPRFVLTLFPCFIVLALIENKTLRFLIISVSGLLLIISTILFVRGYWIG